MCTEENWTGLLKKMGAIFLSTYKSIYDINYPEEFAAAWISMLGHALLKHNASFCHYMAAFLQIEQWFGREQNGNYWKTAMNQETMALRYFVGV